MNTPLEQRINEANINYFALKIRPDDLYMQFRYYKALEGLK